MNELEIRELVKCPPEWELKAWLHNTSKTLEQIAVAVNEEIDATPAAIYLSVLNMKRTKRGYEKSLASVAVAVSIPKTLRSINEQLEAIDTEELAIVANITREMAGTVDIIFERLDTQEQGAATYLEGYKDGVKDAINAARRS